MRLPKLLRPKFYPEELHIYTEDLASLQLQRQKAIDLGNGEEAGRYDDIIEIAQLTLERILEKGK